MKRRVFYITLLVAVLGALAWLVLRPREPSYGGKSLTYWLQQYTQTVMVQHGKEHECEEAKQAIQHIGTNGVPTLLRLVRAKDSLLTLKLYELIEKQHRFKNPFVYAVQRHILANFGFGILAEEAKSAVPDLIKIYRENISEHSRGTAANALGSIGPAAKEAVPALLEGLARTNVLMGADENAIAALGELHSYPEQVMPVLLKYLNDGDSNLSDQLLVMASFSSFGPDARMAVPALLAEATNSDSLLRISAMETLGKIHSEPEAVLPVLMQQLYDKDPSTRSAAVEALTRFGPDAKPAVPELIKALKDERPRVRQAATNALKKIDPEAAAKAGIK